MSGSPPVISFIAPSGTGKTTYLVQLIPLLVERGLRVATVKHDAHSFQMDREGKDTHRLRTAGATRVAIANPRELAVLGDSMGQDELEALVPMLGPVDLVLVEGYREADVPKIVLARGDAPRAPYDAAADGVIAVVADVELPGGRPHFPLDRPEALVPFLIDTFSL